MATKGITREHLDRAAQRLDNMVNIGSYGIGKVCSGFYLYRTLNGGHTTIIGPTTKGDLYDKITLYTAGIEFGVRNANNIYLH